MRAVLLGCATYLLLCLLLCLRLRPLHVWLSCFFLVSWRNDNMPGTRFGAVAYDVFFLLGPGIQRITGVFFVSFIHVCLPYEASGCVRCSWRLTLPGRVCRLWAGLLAHLEVRQALFCHALLICLDAIVFVSPYPGSVVDGRFAAALFAVEHYSPPPSIVWLFVWFVLVWPSGDVWPVLATVVVQDMLLLPRFVMVCYHALVLFNVLFDLAMVSTTFIVLGLHC